MGVVSRLGRPGGGWMSGFDGVEIDDLRSRTPVVRAKTVNLLGSASVTANGSPTGDSHRERVELRPGPAGRDRAT